MKDLDAVQGQKSYIRRGKFLMRFWQNSHYFSATGRDMPILNLPSPDLMPQNWCVAV